MATDEVLRVEGLAKSYRRPERTIEVLNGVSFAVAAGEWLALTGASGCGKTTLLHVLGVLDRPSVGEIAWFGQNVTRMGPFRKAALRRERLGFVFQSYQLFPELCALENVMLPARLKRASGSEARERALALLERVGMADRARHGPAELSGGEQQRVAIARALINQPDVLLADEPTGNLDPKNAAGIMEILRELRDDDGKTIIMVTHDRELAASTDRQLRLADGRLHGGAQGVR